MAASISWKEFESIIKRLQGSFSKDAVVTANEKLLGKNSLRYRQIDVAVRTKIGTENILIIVECKKWTRKPDVKAVEAFAGVKEDVGAQIGIMVSTAGFTSAARNTARAKNISLYRYEDTRNVGWPSGLETHLLIDIWEVTPICATNIYSDNSEQAITDDDDLVLADSKTGESGNLATFVRKMWDTMDPEEKYERLWRCECGCADPEHPEIRKIAIEASSRRIWGYRLGRLLFEGLIDDECGYANVNAWKFVFSGDFTPLRENETLPKTGALSFLMKKTHVITQDVKTEGVQKLLLNGCIELSLETPSVTKIPVGPHRCSSVSEKSATKASDESSRYNPSHLLH